MKKLVHFTENFYSFVQFEKTNQLNNASITNEINKHVR